MIKLMSGESLRPIRTRLLLLIATAALAAGCATAPNEPVPGGASNANITVLPSTPAVTQQAIAPVAKPPVSDAVPKPTAIDTLRPNAPIDPSDRDAQENLWVRIRHGFGMPNLDNELVHVQEQWYATRPDYVERMTARSNRYLFHIVEEIQKRGMPTELALLPFVESAFNPQAMSTAKASGMWQFMSGTGRDYSLKQSIFRDDRRDVLASTRAALDYMEKLYGMFGDWQLALAAYNWGEGNVQKAVARNEKLGLPTDYMSLKMPDETRNYFPKLQAVKNIVIDPQSFSLSLPEIANHPYFLSVPIERDIDVALAVKLADIPMEEFKTLNPQMNRPVILAAGTPQILLPYDNANQFVKAYERHKGPYATWTAWVALKTMRPSEAAKLTGMDEAQLREVNFIPPKMLVKAGSTLLVPRSERIEDDVSMHIADNATMQLAPDVPPLRKITLLVGKRGSSVAAVARQYRIAPSQVAAWNSVTPTTKFTVGDTVVVFVSARSAAANAAARAVVPSRGPRSSSTGRGVKRGTRLAESRRDGGS